MRFERHPGAYTGGRLFLSLLAPDAYDTVSLSYKVERLKAPSSRDTLIMVGQHGKAQVRHLIDLLKIIQRVAPRYGLASLNCWWFAHVVIGTIMDFSGGAWMTPPDSSRVRKIALRFGKDTKRQTDEVTRQFAATTSSSFSPAQLADAGVWQNAGVSFLLEDFRS